MAEDSLQIEIAADAGEDLGRILVALVRDSNGEPLADCKVELSIEGDGTFHAPRHVIQVELVSNQNGEIYEIWYEYPRYEPRRALKSTVWARCDAPGIQISIADIFEPGLHRYRQL